jgi:hypothetical protein
VSASPVTRRPDLQQMLERAYASLSAAISCVHEQPEAALDDILAARLLIAAAAMALGPPIPLE